MAPMTTTAKTTSGQVKLLGMGMSSSRSVIFLSTHARQHLYLIFHICLICLGSDFSTIWISSALGRPGIMPMTLRNKRHTLKFWQNVPICPMTWTPWKMQYNVLRHSSAALEPCVVIPRKEEHLILEIVEKLNSMGWRCRFPNK